MNMWQMRHSVSHVRLNKEFLESCGEVDVLALYKARPMGVVARPVPLKEYAASQERSDISSVSSRVASSLSTQQKARESPVIAISTASKISGTWKASSSRWCNLSSCAGNARIARLEGNGRRSKSECMSYVTVKTRREHTVMVVHLT